MREEIAHRKRCARPHVRYANSLRGQTTAQETTGTRAVFWDWRTAKGYAVFQCARFAVRKGGLAYSCWQRYADAVFCTRRFRVLIMWCKLVWAEQWGGFWQRNAWRILACAGRAMVTRGAPCKEKRHALMAPGFVFSCFSLLQEHNANNLRQKPLGG